MNERFYQIRESLGMNQRDFGSRLGLSSSGISNIEKGIRSVTDKHVKLLVAEFGVNEQWLRTGQGGTDEMFISNADTLVDKLLSDNKLLDEMDRAIIREYIQLPPESRKAIKAYIGKLMPSFLKEKPFTDEYTEFLRTHPALQQPQDEEEAHA